MSFIETTEPGTACGDVAELYRRLQGGADYLPNYARLYCHRPHLMAPLADFQELLKRHMKPRLWALVSLAAAREIRSTYCSLAFARRLLRHHFTAPELLAILNGQADAPLDDSERAAMALAAKVARDAAAVNQADIDSLRSAGFTDAGIFDVVAAAAWRCFFAKVPDALGARPDAALAQVEAPLLRRLALGRAPESSATGDCGPSHSQRQTIHQAEREEIHHEQLA